MRKRGRWKISKEHLMEAIKAEMVKEDVFRPVPVDLTIIIERMKEGFG